MQATQTFQESERRTSQQSQGAERRYSRTIVFMLLLGAIAVGGALRLYRLGDRTMSHPEVYVPRIPLPPYADDPNQRMTPLEVLRTSLVTDIHIPGYHLVMLGWDYTFGTSLFAIRFSSVLFGLLAVLAMFAYARPLFGTSAALLASWLLALHGKHIFWSQAARPWVLLSLLGLVSATLLYRLQRKWSGRVAVAYTLTCAIGLWVDYYFWPIFAGQILWAIFQGVSRDRAPRTLATQLGALILACPILIYMNAHMGRQSHLGGSPWPYIVEMLQFGGLFKHNEVAKTLGAAAPLMFALVTIAGAAALIVGLLRQKTEPATPAVSEDPTNDSRLFFGLLAAAAFITLLTEFVFAGRLGLGHRKIVLAALVAPWALVVLWLVLHRTWSVWSRTVNWLRNIPLVSPLVRMPALLSVGVLLLVVLVHLKKPFLVDYALTAFTPFWVAPMAAGMLSGARRARPIVAGALLLFTFSAVIAERAPSSATDYQSLSRQLIANVQTGDGLWMRRGWVGIPVYYYLKPDHYQFEAPPLPGTPAEKRNTARPPRIWVIEFGEPDRIVQRVGAIERVIPEYTPVRRLSAENAVAVLFVREAR